MEANPPKIKVGSITLALSLVLFGAGLLLYNFGGINSLESVWRLWPLLLIGLGVEYFVRRARRGENEIEFSLPAVILIGIFIVIGISAVAISTVLQGLGVGALVDGIPLGNSRSHVREWQSEAITIEKGSVLDIENAMGEITLESSSDGKLHVTARIIGRAGSVAAARNVANDAQVVVEEGQTTRIYISGKDGPLRSNRVLANLTIQAPPDLNINMENKMGRITCLNIIADLNLESSMGEINVESLQGDLKANSKMGAINAGKVTGNSNLDTEMGRITIQEPGGDVEATTSMGEIQLTSSKPLENHYRLETNNGRIIFRLPVNSNLTVEAKTNHGSITGMKNNGEPVSNNDKKMVLGGGKGSAELTTGNGSIEVTTN